MKRFVITFVIALIPFLSVQGRDKRPIMEQNLKPYSIERVYRVPGVDKYELSRRAEKYFRDADRKYRTLYDYRFDRSARAREYIYWEETITSHRKKYRCDIQLQIAIYPSNDGYRVRLDRVHVHAYRGNWLILEDNMGLGEDDTHDYDGFLRKKEMYALAQEVKKFAAAEFEKYLPEIISVMDTPIVELHER